MDTPAPASQPDWNTLIEARKQRADYYFQTVLGGLDCHYAARSRKGKSQYYGYAIAVIFLGAMVTLVQAFDGTPWMRYLTAGLGSLLTLFKTIETLVRPGDFWRSYWWTSEQMRREYRLYINNADVYFTDAKDEESAYRLLVARVETIIGEAEQTLLQRRGSLSRSASGDTTSPSAVPPPSSPHF